MADRSRAAVDVVTEDGAGGTAAAPGSTDDGRTAPGSRHQESTRSDEAEAAKPDTAEAADDGPTADGGPAEDDPAEDKAAEEGAAEEGPADEQAEDAPADDDPAAGSPAVEAAVLAPAEDAPAESATPEAGTDPVPTLRPVPVRHSGDKVANRYRLEECISQAGVFTSWRAVDEKLRRAVGIHLLAAGHERSRAVLAAARRAALLGDLRFVQVLDAVTDGDLVYIVREWLPDATDLASLLATGPMEPYDAYRMVRQVTDAVAVAHRRGQSHLRLTPTCVLRTDSGQYRINGLAVDAALHGLSDEQAELDDTRAIGALLYAALAHRWPYPEDKYDLQGMPKEIGCVPPDQVRAGVHRGLSEIAVRALCDEPPRHLAPITTPEELAKAIALLPKVRPPEPEPVLPVYTAPSYPQQQPTHARSSYPPPTAARPRPVAPAAAAPPAAPPVARRGRGRGRRVVKWGASALLLVALGLGSWQLATQFLDRDGDTGDSTHSTSSEVESSGKPTPTKSAPQPLPVVHATDFDPFGSDRSEKPQDIPKAFDGDPSTYWRTDGYTRADFGGVKPGVGIILDLGSAKNVAAVTVRFGGSTKVTLLAAPPDATSAPSSFDGFTPLTDGSGTDVSLKPAKPTKSRFLLVWLTELPATDSGSLPYRGQVSEIKVSG
ncbi:protein kinase family protein [Streptomyces sp. NPDC092296]|uniref:protein kinase family protein n=1 Tax=Streptomyces sp. NPDC092296 TaxID=3366012 RepID=UPI003813AA7A